MKRQSLLICIVLGILGGTAFSQKEEKEANEVPAFVAKFGNLPEEKRKAYGEHKIKADQFFRQKRTFESLDQIHQALAIFDEDPSAWNLLGSCHVEFRSFSKAKKAFQRAMALDAGNNGILFNLAEMDFVTKQWKSCSEKMMTLAKRLEEEGGEMPESSLSLHRLAIFKSLLSELKLGNEQKSREMAKEYSLDWDDTPFTYYSKAAFAYFEDDGEEANRWINTAVRVFGGVEQVANWQDTLIEFGYVKSFYGGEDGGTIEVSKD